MVKSNVEKLDLLFWQFIRWKMLLIDVWKKGILRRIKVLSLFMNLKLLLDKSYHLIVSFFLTLRCSQTKVSYLYYFYCFFNVTLSIHYRTKLMKLLRIIFNEIVFSKIELNMEIFTMIYDISVANKCQMERRLNLKVA